MDPRMMLDAVVTTAGLVVMKSECTATVPPQPFVLVALLHACCSPSQQAGKGGFDQVSMQEQP